MSKRPNILPTRASFFISSARKIECAGVYNKVFRVTISLLMTVIQKLYGHIYIYIYSSFQRTGYFVILR